MKTVLVASIALLLSGCVADDAYPKQCGTMLDGWVSNEYGFGILGMANDVRLSKDGQLTFNHKSITSAQLAEYSRSMRVLEPRVFLTFAVDEGTSCEQVDHVRKIITEGMDCGGENRGLCGEGSGPWPIYGDVVPFAVVQQYQDGKRVWLAPAMSEKEWRAKVARHPKS